LVEEIASGLLHWLLSTTPDFWSAAFTFGLLAVAIVTAIIGLRALRTANDTLQLEGAPYLIVAAATSSNAYAERYVISAPEPRLGLVPRLRAWDYQRDERTTPGLNPHYGGRPLWPQVLLAVKNVGRSPAVGVRLDATFVLELPLNLNYAAIAAARENVSPWLAGSDFPHEARDGEGGFGTIELTAIMPTETVYVSVENRYAAKVRLRFARTATMTSSRGARFPIAAYVPQQPVEIKYTTPLWSKP
jgi:hypothetical protein